MRTHTQWPVVGSRAAASIDAAGRTTYSLPGLLAHLLANMLAVLSGIVIGVLEPKLWIEMMYIYACYLDAM